MIHNATVATVAIVPPAAGAALRKVWPWAVGWIFTGVGVLQVIGLAAAGVYRVVQARRRRIVLREMVVAHSALVRARTKHAGTHLLAPLREDKDECVAAAA